MRSVILYAYLSVYLFVSTPAFELADLNVDLDILGLDHILLGIEAWVMGQG